MSVPPYSVLTVPNPVLRQKAMPVEGFGPDLRAQAQAMLEAMAEAGGVGLAAPQVGLLRRFFVMHVRADDTRVPPDHPLVGKPLVLVNPEIAEASSEMKEEMEACLSIPGFAGLVQRHVAITVQARNEWGKPKRYRLEGYLARVIQHEMDHLDGVLYLDRLTGEDKLFEVRPALEEEDVHAG